MKLTVEGLVFLTFVLCMFGVLFGYWLGWLLF
jgi:hypothetical protein